MRKKGEYKRKLNTTISDNNISKQVKNDNDGKKIFVNFIEEDKIFCNKYPVLNKIPLLRIIFYIFYKEGWYYSVTLLITTGLYLLFSLSHLGKFIYTDEPVLWLFNWIPQYWEAIKTGNWDIMKQTLTYPAIPVLFFGGLFSHNLNISDFPPEIFDQYLFWIKSPVIFFNYITLFVIYFLVRKMWDKNYAILVTGLIALHPLIISFSQHTQGDTTLWNCFVITFLFYNLYLKNGGIKYILLTSLFFALSVLSKFSGILLYPLLFIFLYFQYIVKTITREQFIDKFKGLMLIYLAFFIFVFILFPACWTDLKYLFNSTFNHLTLKSINLIFIIFAIILVLEVVFKGFLSGKLRQYFNFNKLVVWILSLSVVVSILFVLINNYSNQIYFSPKDAGVFGDVIVKNFQSSLYWAFQTLTEIMPWFFYAGIAVAIIFGIIKKTEFSTTYINLLLITFLSFFIGSALNSFQMWAKYQVFIIPIYSLLFALMIIPLLKNYKKIIISLFLLLMLGETLSSYPNYFFYKNRFIPMDFINQSQVDGNYGGYELAQILNKIPGSDTLKVLSDTFGFMYFFKGENQVIEKAMTFDQIKEFDYLYLTTFGYVEKTSWALVPYGLLKYYEQDLDSAFAYFGNKQSYAKIIKVDKNFEKFLPENAFDTEFYFDLKTNNSLAFWVKPFTNTHNEIFIIGHNENDEIFISADSTGIFSGYNNSVTIKNDTLILNNWQHVTWINELIGDSTSKRKLYYNGVLVSDTIIKRNGNPVKGIFINSKFAGQINDIRIFRDVLTDKQIQVIYNNGVITTEPVLKDGEKEFYPIRHFTIQTSEIE